MENSIFSRTLKGKVTFTLVKVNILLMLKIFFMVTIKLVLGRSSDMYPSYSTSLNLFTDLLLSCLWKVWVYKCCQRQCYKIVCCKATI